MLLRKLTILFLLIFAHSSVDQEVLSPRAIQAKFDEVFRTERIVLQYYNLDNLECGTANLGIVEKATSPMQSGFEERFSFSTRLSPAGLRFLETLNADQVGFLFARQIGQYMSAQFPRSSLPWDTQLPASWREEFKAQWYFELRSDAWAGCALSESGAALVFDDGLRGIIASTESNKDLPPFNVMLTAMSAGSAACANHEASKLPERLGGHSPSQLEDARKAISEILNSSEHSYLEGKRRLGILGPEAKRQGGYRVLRVQNDVSKTIEQLNFLTETLTSLAERLSNKGLFGLALFVDKNIERLPTTPPVPNSLESGTWVKIVDRVFSKLEYVAQDLSVNPRVESEPSDAQVIVTSKNGHVQLRATTNSAPVPNVFRGIYLYNIKRNGSKEGRGELDLIDRPGMVIACSLQPLDSSLDSFCEAR